MRAPRRFPPALVGALLITTTTLTLACARERGPGASPGDPSEQDDGPQPAARAALAAAIDPGPVTPMSAELPPWIAEQVALVDALPEAEREAMIRATVEAFTGEQAFALLSQPGPLLALAQAIAVLEARDAHGQASVAELVDLQALYAVLDQPVFAHQNGMFVQFLPTILAAARAEGGEGSAARIDEIEGFTATLFERMRRAEPLRRALLARLLRELPPGPDDAILASVLASVANNLGRRDPELALEAVRLARELDPNPTRELDLAYRCALVLDLACADAALERASVDEAALDEAARTRLAELRDETRVTAGRAVASASATDLDGRLEHARALFDLGLYDQAEPVFAALRRDHPRDARPLTGLARIKMAACLDVAAAAQLLAHAGPLEQREAEYYEITIAAQVLQLFNAVLPRVMSEGTPLEAALAEPLARLRVDIEGSMADGSELAVVLEALLGLTERGLPLLRADDRAGQAALVREALDQAVALQRRLPNQPHAYVLLMAAAELMPDEQAAVAAASTPVPAPAAGASVSHLHLRQAQALLNLAITWADPSLLPAVEAALMAIPAGEHEQARLLTAANMYAVGGRLEERPEYLHEAIGLYQLEFERFTGPIGLNNLAVLLAASGDTEQAGLAFTRAVELGGDKAIVARLNAAILDRSSVGTAELEAIASDEAGNASVRRRAMAELAERSLGRPAAAWAEQGRALLAEPSILPRTLDLPNAAGALLLGQVAFDVSYSIDGLVLTADVASTPWLVLPPAKLR